MYKLKIMLVLEECLAHGEIVSVITIIIMPSPLLPTMKVETSSVRYAATAKVFIVPVLPIVPVPGVAILDSTKPHSGLAGKCVIFI